MPKLSVIVPVYKAEKYIEKCAISLFEQTLDDIEYIFIDDCTPDNSIDILKGIIKQYPNRIKNIKIIRMEKNSRQAAVRKYGMQLALGDYVIHCDSDDWVDNDYYEKMYLAAIHDNADVVFAPVVHEYVTSSTILNFEHLPNTGKKIVANWFCTNIPMYTVNKLVRRKIFQENQIYPFEGVNMWEDNGLMLRILYYSNRVTSIVGAAYHYNQTNVAATTKGYGKSAVDQMLKCAKLLDEFFRDKSDAHQYQKTVNAVKYLAKLNLITTQYKGIREFKQIYPESDEAVNYISLNAFSIKGKIRYLFVKYHLSWLFVSLFKCLNLFSKK